jgi:hypothetical protein
LEIKNKISNNKKSIRGGGEWDDIEKKKKTEK